MVHFIYNWNFISTVVSQLPWARLKTTSVSSCPRWIQTSSWVVVPTFVLSGWPWGWKSQKRLGCIIITWVSLPWSESSFIPAHLWFPPPQCPVCSVKFKDDLKPHDPETRNWLWNRLMDWDKGGGQGLPKVEVNIGCNPPFVKVDKDLLKSHVKPEVRRPFQPSQMSPPLILLLKTPSHSKAFGQTVIFFFLTMSNPAYCWHDLPISRDEVWWFW